MYVLLLNDMRSHDYGTLKPVAKSKDPQKLVDFMLRQKYGLYHDEHYVKVFRLGGPLEWYNAPMVPYTVEDLMRSRTGRIEDWSPEADTRYSSIYPAQYSLHEIPDVDTRTTAVY